MCPKRLTEEERAHRAWSERDLQARVIELAHLYGWNHFHVGDSRKMVRRGDRTFMVGDRDAKGFPDLVIIRPPEIIFWELKKELGKTTPEQDEWLCWLAECSLEARVIRPSDLETHVIPRLKRRCPG